MITITNVMEMLLFDVTVIMIMICFSLREHINHAYSNRLETATKNQCLKSQIHYYNNGSFIK